MSRVLLAAACAVLAFPMLAAAADKKRSAPVSPGEAKPGKCQTCDAPKPAVVPASFATADRPGSFGRELQARLFWDEHMCAPDGCPTPVGCGNLWTERKFIFGSCRQFFGTAGGSVGHSRRTWARE